MTISEAAARIKAQGYDRVLCIRIRHMDLCYRMDLDTGHTGGKNNFRNHVATNDLKCFGYNLWLVETGRCNAKTMKP